MSTCRVQEGRVEIMGADSTYKCGDYLALKSEDFRLKVSITPAFTREWSETFIRKKRGKNRKR
jgi:hypothetical protein